MLDLNKTAVDPKLVEAGTWWTVRIDSNGRVVGDHIGPELGPEHDGVAVMRIAPTGTSFDRAMEEERDRLYASGEEKLTDQQQQALMGRALACSVVRDWRNIAMNGERLEWSQENAARVLSMPEQQDLREYCYAAASNRKAVRQRQIRDDEGN
tara:strand:+ start:429 stop:887 length:459 start_codon:yes stop_codon:yes gene_type:complete